MRPGRSQVKVMGLEPVKRPAVPSLDVRDVPVACTGTERGTREPLRSLTRT